MDERQGLRITTWNGKPYVVELRALMLTGGSERNQVSIL
jgi:hypothetical protein